MSRLTGGGILVTGSNEITITRNRLQRLAAGPILLHGNTQKVVLVGNGILGNLGSSNWAAGIVLTDRNANLEINPEDLFRDDGYWGRERPIATRPSIPRNNLIAYNHIAGNASSGIYSDGRNVFNGNQVENNSKEGLCLDYGSAADVIASNLFRRQRQTLGQERY
jgi:hypothetical protein